MGSDNKIINRVDQSGILSLDLEDYFPKGEIAEFDLKDYLFKGLILKEQDFRTSLKETDWQQYEGKNVALFCSADAIIPFWAYMLVATYLEPYTANFALGNKETLENILFQKSLSIIDIEQFRNQRVVVKGCGDKPIPVAAYVEITRLLRPVAKSIMYGEPCSTVPLYKRKEQV